METFNLNKFREGMEISKGSKLYLDHAAMSPLHNRVVERITRFHTFRQQEGADFGYWWQLVEETRALLGKWLQTSPEHIAFLWNTSAGINLAAKGFPLEAGDEIIITDQEFPSNVYPWHHIARERDANVTTVKYHEHGLSVEDIIEAVSERTKLISVSWVNATNGNKLDVAKLGTFCRENNIYFVIDAIQGIGTDDLNVTNVYADLIVSGTFKWLMGPDGLSFVYLSERALQDMHTPWIGWASMEDKFNYENIHYEPANAASRYETGNMNFSAIAGLNEALQQLLPIRRAVYERISLLTERLWTGLKAIPGITIRSPEQTMSGITLFTGREKSFYDERQITVNYRSGIRVSPHFYNTKEEIDTFLTVTESSK